MVTQASRLGDKLISHLHYLEKTRRKMEDLFSRHFLVKRDVDQIYEGLYIDAISSFEMFIEQLFISLLTKKCLIRRRRILKASFKNASIAKNVIYDGRNYHDWLPYDKTIKKAKIYFNEGQPFSRVDVSSGAPIVEMYVIRNAIAHSSVHSRRQFETKVIARKPLLPQEKTPAGYLRGLYRTAPNQTRYESYMIEMSNITRNIST